MTQAITMLALANDEIVIHGLETFFRLFTKNLNSSTEDLINGCDQTELLFKDSNMMKIIKARGMETLGEADSINLARRLLWHFGQEEKFQELVLKSLTEWDDTTKKIGRKVTLAMIVSLHLLIATTEFTYEGEKVKIQKKAATTEQIVKTGKLIGKCVQSFIDEKDQ